MSRRSPLNNRYQKKTKPPGATRKSAARARPAYRSQYQAADKAPKAKWYDRFRKGNASGASAQAGAVTNRPAKKSGNNDKAWLTATPDTPEYKRLRKQWWIFLGIGVVLLALSLASTRPWFYETIRIPAATANKVSIALSWTALAVVAFSWWLDFKKIRPLIKEAQAEAKRKQKKNKS
ncbi:MAG: hypothetical protein LBS17_01830 [Actinomycetes bacterium]|nr:hypothetical protein [Actinomycetes bacterium]